MTQVKENGDWGSILDAMSQSFGREIEEMVRQEVYPRSDEDPKDKDYQDYLLACQERLPVVYYGTNCEKRVFAGEGGFDGMVTDREERAIAEAKVTVYQWLNHDFKKVWSGETDEEGHYQAEEIPYGLLTYNGTDQYDKIYLWADSFVQAMNPGIQTLSQRNGLYGLLEGFKIIGLGEPAAAYYEFMEYTLNPDSPYIFPSYWGKDELKKSFQYRRTGVGNYSARDMTVTLSDETALKEHIEALER